MATITKLGSGSWRVQGRRKGEYANGTFLRRETGAREVERRIDRGEPIQCDRDDTKTFGALIDLHRRDLAEVGKALGRSNALSLDFLAMRLGSFDHQAWIGSG